VTLLVLGGATRTCQDKPAPDAPQEVKARPAQSEAAPPAYERPAPPAAAERRREREIMVERQIAHPADGRAAVQNQKVLEAMRRVPRHVFVPEAHRADAYADSPLPIGHGQTISQPYMVALMTELLEVGPESKVLEIGTGSGYQAAVLAHLTPHVCTIEIIQPLQERAALVLEEQGYREVRTLCADGYHGWAERGPYDAIIVTCAAGHLPPPLWEQVVPGGRIVIPIGSPYEIQRLVVMTKKPDGTRESRTVTDVRFVPLTRAPEP
jgi:protein-L-isoaspartate(D-aspartate) O-methyltransferase